MGWNDVRWDRIGWDGMKQHRIAQKRIETKLEGGHNILPYTEKETVWKDLVSGSVSLVWSQQDKHQTIAVTIRLTITLSP